MDERRFLLEKQLQQWLGEMVGCSDFTLKSASGDASFRRYFRVGVNGDSFIAMDAPPEQEDCRPFVAISQAIIDAGLHVPQVLKKNLEQGFLLLTDLGDQQYLGVLNQTTVQSLYSDAMRALLILQQAQPPRNLLPDYNHDLLMKEMALFLEWFVSAYLGLKLSPEVQRRLISIFELLASQAIVQPQVWVHRDYHSRNLMWIDKDDIDHSDHSRLFLNPGILDFQDAVIGPVCYDLVSLLRDCYINWPQQQVGDWVEQYRCSLIDAGIIAGTISSAEFLRWFDLMGVQRHLKAIGIFSRLNIRDNKSGYLQDIPRTLLYVIQVCRSYHELQPMYEWLQDAVVPLVMDVLPVDADYYSTD